MPSTRPLPALSGPGSVRDQLAPAVVAACTNESV
jgi:hypothetical protein